MLPTEESLRHREGLTSQKYNVVHHRPVAPNVSISCEEIPNRRVSFFSGLGGRDGLEGMRRRTDTDLCHIWQLVDPLQKALRPGPDFAVPGLHKKALVSSMPGATSSPSRRRR
jgi:hypothetical protein